MDMNNNYQTQSEQEKLYNQRRSKIILTSEELRARAQPSAFNQEVKEDPEKEKVLGSSNAHWDDLGELANVVVGFE